MCQIDRIEYLSLFLPHPIHSGIAYMTDRHGRLPGACGVQWYEGVLHSFSYQGYLVCMTPITRTTLNDQCYR